MLRLYSHIPGVPIARVHCTQYKATQHTIAMPYANIRTHTHTPLTHDYGLVSMLRLVYLVSLSCSIVFFIILCSFHSVIHYYFYSV